MRLAYTFIQNCSIISEIQSEDHIVHAVSVTDVFSVTVKIRSSETSHHATTNHLSYLSQIVVFRIAIGLLGTTAGNFKSAFVRVACDPHTNYGFVLPAKGLNWNIG